MEESRLPNGRFVKGCPGGPGASYSGKVTALKRTLYESVSQDDVRDCVRELLVMAKTCQNDSVKIAAIRTLFDRLFGKPKETVEVEQRTSAIQAEAQEQLLKCPDVLDAALQLDELIERCKS